MVAETSTWCRDITVGFTSTGTQHYVTIEGKTELEGGEHQTVYINFLTQNLLYDFVDGVKDAFAELKEHRVTQIENLLPLSKDPATLRLEA